MRAFLNVFIAYALTLGMSVVSSANDDTNPKVKGMDREAIRLAFRKQLKKIRGCYDESLKHNPNISGKVIVGLQVREEGSVEKVKIESGIDAGVDECIIEIVAKMQFDPLPKGQNAYITYPFVFSAQ